jgi:uncharacterized protein (DUF1919 family)
MKALLLDQYRSLRDKYYERKRLKYAEMLKPHFSSNVSIISSNCLAGRIYQDLRVQYNSPTLGLYFMYPDYINFLQNLESNLKAPISFVTQSKYPSENERMALKKHSYPIGLLNGDIEIHFLHYTTEEEAYEKWKRRCERVNFDNLIVIASEQNLASKTDVVNFEKLSFEKKMFFTSEDYLTNSSVFIKEFEGMGKTGDPYREGGLYYRDMLSFINNSKW